MELPGETYLFNLSILAITFAVVSAVVMLVRQTMGGKLSNFDVYLITAYVSGGFVVVVGAVLPPLIALFEPSPAILWATASGLAAVLLAARNVTVVLSRRAVSSMPMSTSVVGVLTAQWIAVLLLAANIVVTPAQGVGPFATALTLSLVLGMYAFVRRIASLLGDKPSEDWDPRRG